MIAQRILFLIGIAPLFTSAQEPNNEFHNMDADYYNVSADGVVADGYDVVSYFKSNEALKGSEEFVYSHDGQFYYFTNAKNRLLFLRNPKKYMPQFGGYCAFGVGMEQGEGFFESAKAGKHPSDPKTFKIIDKKLYLFYNGQYGNALRKWNNNEMKFLKNAHVHWKEMHPDY